MESPGVHIAGTLCIALAAFLYLIPFTAAVLLTRVVHGAGWAAFNTGGGTAVAELAPGTRRGEAAGIYNLMPGIANMVMPATALLLLAAEGFESTFLLAAVFGILAVAVLALGPSTPTRRAPAREGVRFWNSLLERSALLPLGLEFCFTLIQTLFWVYPPVFAQALGIPFEGLAAYYVPVGISVVLSRLIVGRRLDRVSRQSALLIGAGMAAAALAAAERGGLRWLDPRARPGRHSAFVRDIADHSGCHGDRDRDIQ